MKIIIENIKTPIDADDYDIIQSAVKRINSLHVFSAPSKCEIYKRSVDARHKDKIMFVCSVSAEVEMIKNDINFSGIHDVKLASESELDIPDKVYKSNISPVIAGFGPAGMFCALVLAERGLNPIILERGGSIDERIESVERFYNKGILNTECNIQFGAGGAGTFSDGKLTTRINDSRCSYILRRFVDFGAPYDIMHRAKPHIGTDILRDIVKNIDEKIRSLGGVIKYNTRLEDVIPDKNYIVTSCGDEIEFSSLVIATGHSARDTYFRLLGRNFCVEAKNFSVGVRIEHLQSDIDRAMYGTRIADDPKYIKKIGHAEYTLSHRNQSSGRGVYTFCMCPGGEVMAAASEDNMLVVNGMSRRARDGDNANSAVAVSVSRDDFGSSPESAIEFQRNLERRAFTAGGSDWRAPVQTVGDYIRGTEGKNPDITPSYMGGKYNLADINKIFPDYINKALKTGLAEFNKKIAGFAGDKIPLTGVETRTSAPVRILRNDNLTAIGYANIYPCGEGAGYAGGIMSAAADGIRVAERILSSLKTN